MSQLPITPSVPGTKVLAQLTDVAEVSQTAESVEQAEATTFEGAMQAVMDTLESENQPVLGWAVTIATDPMSTSYTLQNGSFMPGQSASAGKSLPFQFGEPPLPQPEMIKPAGLPETETGLLMEKLMGKIDPASVSPVLSATTDGMLHALDSRHGSELTSQAVLSGIQPLSSNPIGKSGVVTLPVDVPVGQPGWDKAVGDRIQWMIGRNLQNAEIKLTPPNLGPMEIRISVQNDQASVSFIAAQASTREALEAATPRLKEMLGEANLNLVDVDVGQRNGSESTQGEESDGGAPSHAGAHETTIPDKNRTILTRLVSDGLVDDYA